MFGIWYLVFVVCYLLFGVLVFVVCRLVFGVSGLLMGVGCLVLIFDV